MELALVAVVQAHTYPSETSCMILCPIFVMAYLRVLSYPSASTSPFSINL